MINSVMTNAKLSKIPPISHEDQQVADCWKSLVMNVESPSSLMNREAINANAQQLSVSLVPELLDVLAFGKNENDRETALKTLALIGGERAVSAIELICTDSRRNSKDDRWLGQLAAAKALRTLGLTEIQVGTNYEDAHKAAIFNPTELKDYFSNLVIAESETDWKEFINIDRAPGRKFDSLAEISNSLSSISFLDMGQICLTLNLEFNVQNAQESFEGIGLKVDLLSDNAIRVVGDGWPGSKLLNPTLDIIFISLFREESPKSRILIKSIPEATDVYSWESALRLLTRFAIWGGKTELSQSELSISKVTSTSLADQENLLWLAEEIS